MNHLKQSFYKAIPVLMVAMFVLCTLHTHGQLSGIKTVGSGGNYPTIEAAIADLDAVGVGTGGVTFNVAAGHTETLSNSLAGLITNAATGTASRPVVFQKSGVGANPLITAPTGVSNSIDGIIILSSCDYITFDGIDLQENPANTTNTTRMEYGYALLKNSITNGVRNITIKNCTITLNKANPNSVGIHIGNHRHTSTNNLNIDAASGTSRDITITGNTISNVYVGIEAKGYFGGATTLFDRDLQITNNTVSNFGGSATQASGIEINGQTTLTVSGNNISSGSATTINLHGIVIFAKTNGVNCNGNIITGLSGSADVFGISCVSDSTSTVEKNKIGGLRTASTDDFSVTGIRLFNGSARNNLVGDLEAKNATSHSAVNGILLNNTSATAVTLYYNTIYLACDSGASGGSNAVFANTAPIVTFQNNIFVNNSTVGTAVAYRRLSSTISSYGAASNNNVFFANPSAPTYFLYADGSNNLSSLLSLQTFMAGRESNSMCFLPVFMSTDGSHVSFLLVDASVASPLESAGIAVSGISTDYTGQSRHATMPDIGADEFTGTKDFVAPVISYTAFANDNAAVTRNVTNIIITDATCGVNTVAGNRPRLYFKKSTDNNTINDNTNTTAGWKFVEANGTTSPFDFSINYSKLNGGVTFGNTIQYFIVAQDQYGIPNVATGSGIFTTSPSSVALLTANIPSGTFQSYELVLPNTVTIGSNGIDSLAEAIRLLNTLGIPSGGITVNIPVGYRERFTSTGAGTITATGTSLNPIIFQKSGSGINPLIFPAKGTGTTDGIIKIAGGDYITFDGIDLKDSLTDLTGLAKNIITEWGYALLKGSTTDPVRNVAIRNCNVTMHWYSSPSYAITYGIYAGNHLTGSITPLTISDTSGVNRNILITGNTISGAVNGIYVQGVSNAGTSGRYDSDLEISSNTVTGSLNSSIETVSQANVKIHSNLVKDGDVFGIYAYVLNVASIHKNTVHRSRVTTDSRVYGIFADGKGTITISSNSVYDLRMESYSPSYTDVIGIFYAGASGGNGVISNNMVGNIKVPTGGNGDGVNPAVKGIYIGGSKASLYHNTVYLDCDSGLTGFSSYALFAELSDSLDLRNNILVNNSSYGTAIAFYHYTSQFAYSSASNNNVFYAGTPSSSHLIFESYTEQKQTLADYKNHVSPRDNVSLSFLPAFLNTDGSSANFLHINPAVPSPLESAGIPVGGITEDVDGATRQNPPDIGADEFAGTKDLVSPLINYTPLANTNSILSFNATNITITDAGTGVNITLGKRPRLYYKKSTDANVINDNTSSTTGWKYAEANGSSSPFDFTIDYTKLNGSASFGNTIEYFIVAQDQYAIPNVSTGSGTFTTTPESVNLTTANIPSGTLPSYRIILPNSITIGSNGMNSVAQAISCLNTLGVPSGGITVNVPAGYREWFTNSTAGVITATGTITDCVVFTKSGAGTNPVLIAGYGMGSSDGIIVVEGGDYFTFDGLDIKDTSYNYNQFPQPEWGYAILKKNTADGAKHITIRNCNISLNKAHPSSAGIYIDNRTVSSTASLNVVAGGTHEFIRIYNNAISNVYIGIDVNKGTYTQLFDSNLEIGISGGNAISNFGGGAYITYGIRLGGVYGAKIANNIIDSSYGNTNYTYGIYQYTGTGEIIANHVSDLSSSNPVHGVYFIGDSCSIKKNVIAGLSGSSVFGALTYNVFSSVTNQNKVYRLTATASNGVAYGISTYCNTSTIQNNIIGDLHAPSSIVANAVNGIYLWSTVFFSNIYHNTVNLNCVGAGAAFGSNALYAHTNATLDLRNNILVNNATGSGTAAAYRRSNATLSSYSSTSNNNVLYAGTPLSTHLLFTDGSNPIQTLADYQNHATPRDNASLSFMPSFLSTDGSSANFLHIDPAVETLLESGGTIVPGITEDFDSDNARAAYPLSGQLNGEGTAPDIGADEFDGSRDKTPPLITFTPFSNHASLSSRKVSGISITDLSGINTASGTKPRLYYKKQNELPVINGNTNTTSGWKYVEANEMVSPLSFTIDYTKLNSTMAINDTILYFMVAQDLRTIANISVSHGDFTTVPATVSLTTANLPVGNLGSFVNVFPDSAIFTIDAATGDYSTIESAISILNLAGPPQGGITFNVTSGHTESFSNTAAGLITATGAADKPIVFQKSGAGVNPLITAPTGTSTTSDGIVKIAGGDYITIDGIDLQEKSANTNATTRMEWGYAILRKSANDGAKVIRIRNCTITLNKSNPCTGIYAASQTATGGGVTISSIEGRDSSFIISGNTISNVTRGIYITCSNGGSSSYVGTGAEISFNSISNFASSSNISNGIYIENNTGTVISFNTVSSGSTSAPSHTLNGIYFLPYSSGHKCTINNNKVFNLRQTHTTGRVIGIFAQGSDNMFNNLVSDLDAPASITATAVRGIDNSSSQNMHHNTVYLTCTGAGGAFSSAALRTFNSPLIRNNIFINRSAGTAIAFYYSNGSLGSSSNNNLWYAGVPSPTNLLFSNGTIHKQSLAEFKTYLSPRESASISTDVNFISTDGQSAFFLHPDTNSASALESRGLVIAGITGDFDDNSSRSSYPKSGQLNGGGSAPDIGAYEFDGIADVIAPVIVYTPLGNQATTAATVLSGVSVTDNQQVDVSAGKKPRLYYKRIGDENVINDNTATTQGWKYVECSGTVSPFDFSFDYSLLYGGTVIPGDVFQYFVVAQDAFIIHNIGINSGTFSSLPESVNLQTVNIPQGTLNSFGVSFSTGGMHTVGLTGEFKTIAAAIAAINILGVPAGGITFDVEAGHTETFPYGTSGLITASGSFSSPVVFQKTGTGPNPLITSASGGGTGGSDGLIIVEGGDYFTFDGIDLRENSGNTHYTPQVEYGYQIAQKSASNGCNNITIKNCRVTISNTGITIASPISVTHNLRNGSGVALNALGRKRNIRIEGNIINGGFSSIYVLGNSTYRDSGLIIRQNNISNFITSGITTFNQDFVRIESNTVSDGNGLSSGLTYAININNSNTVAIINGNRISDITGVSGKTIGINIQSSTVTVSNNIIYDIRSPSSTSPTGVVGIENSINTYTVLFYHNTILLSCQAGGTGFGSVALNLGSGSHTLINNILINKSVAGTSVALMRSIASLSAYQTVSNNNLFYAGAPSPTNLLYTDGTNTKQTLADLKAFVSPRESTSISENISFIASDSLRPAAGFFRLGASISGQTTDINGVLRSDPPDIGAYEGREPGRWIGGTSTNWNVLNNWDDSIVPVTAVDFLIDTNAVNAPILGANLQANNLYIPSGKNLDLNGNNLIIGGTFSGNGTIKGHPSSSITISGSGSTPTLRLDQATPGSSNRLRNLTINRTGATINLGDSIQISGALTLTNGTLNTGGVLTLVSNSEGTAYMPELGNGAAITGNVKVERYIPSTARRWRFMASPLANATFEDWRSEVYLTGAGTGSTIGSLNSNGFDASASNSPSVYWYDEMPAGPSANGWTALTNNTSSLTNLPILPGKGYRVFIRGDRSSLARLTGVDASQNSVTLNLNGPVNTGDIAAQVSCANGCNDAVNDGWNLLGNPYPSPFSWKNFRSDADSSFSNISQVIYIYDAVSNSYQYYNALSDAGTIEEGIIASGQAFYVQAIGQSPSLTFKEKYKTTGTPTQLFKSSASKELSITLKTDSINYDRFILKIIDSATVIHDRYDANKMSGSTNISSYGKDNVYHSLDARPLLAAGDSVTLHVNAAAGNQQLIFHHIPQVTGMYFYLEDRYLQSVTMIDAGLVYPFTIVSSIPATQGGARFRIITSNSRTLPVTWLSLNAENINDATVQLKWNTADEKNCSHFVIERSYETMNAFEETGVVKASTKQNINTYHFVDAHAFNRNIQTIFYRIKQVDHDGRFTFSGIAAVSNNEMSDAPGITVFPVPANDVITVAFPQQDNYPVNMIVTDVSGKTILHADTETLNGKLTINIGQLEPGIYFLRCMGETFGSYTTTFIKQ